MLGFDRSKPASADAGRLDAVANGSGASSQANGSRLPRWVWVVVVLAVVAVVGFFLLNR